MGEEKIQMVKSVENSETWKYEKDSSLAPKLALRL